MGVDRFRFLSKAFISLIEGLIIPLLLSTILVDIAQTGDIRAVGRMGAKAFICFEAVTTLTLCIGLLVANWLKPGVNLLPRPWGPHLGHGCHGQDQLGKSPTTCFGRIWSSARQMATSCPSSASQRSSGSP
jgi:hypothetical protein